jgi:hypothetical protein
MMRCMPTSPTTTRQEYDVYKLKTPQATTESHERMIQFYKQVTSEDVALCNQVQKNLQGGIYASGICESYNPILIAIEGWLTPDSSTPISRRRGQCLSIYGEADSIGTFRAGEKVGAQDIACCNRARGG